MYILYSLFLGSQPSIAAWKAFDFTQPNYGEMMFHKICVS